MLYYFLSLVAISGSLCLVWLNTNIAMCSASYAKHTSSYLGNGLICRGQDVSAFYPKPDVILLADVVYYEEVSIQNAY